MAAAARAASVAPDTAMPTSAFLRAGASFTPSPVMPTMWPRFCSASTMLNLCSGNTWANPSAASIAFCDRGLAAGTCFGQMTGVEMLEPNAELARRLLRDRRLVSRHHFDRNAHCSGSVDRRSGILPHGVEERDHTEHLPLAIPSVRATPRERYPRAAKPTTAFSTSALV